MCLICSNPASSKDDLEKAAAKHKKDRLTARAAELKELIRDCKNIIRIHEEAGTRDEWTERLLDKLKQQQYALAREM